MAYIHGTQQDEQRRLAALNRLSNPPFLEFLDAAGAGSILEVGSGLGILTREVAARWPAARVTGVEHSAAQLARVGNDLPPNVSFIEGDAHALPFGDGSFDVVYCRFLLEHVSQPDVVCAEMFRVLAKGGRVFVQENDVTLQRFDPPTPKFDRVWSRLPQLQERLGGDALIGSKLFRILKNAGFHDISLSYSPEIFAAGDPRLVTWIDNLSDILRGCEAELITHELGTQQEVEDAVREIFALRQREDASSWFPWNRASATK